jgi:hypothetical protein
MRTVTQTDARPNEVTAVMPRLTPDEFDQAMSGFIPRSVAARLGWGRHRAAEPTPRSTSASYVPRHHKTWPTS